MQRQRLSVSAVGSARRIAASLEGLGASSPRCRVSKRTPNGTETRVSTVGKLPIIAVFFDETRIFSVALDGTTRFLGGGVERWLWTRAGATRHRDARRRRRRCAARARSGRGQA